MSVSNPVKQLIRRVNDFWLAGIKSSSPVPKAVSARWFGGGDAFDREIREKFGADIEAVGAADGPDKTYPELLSSPEGVLASTILLDQFTRNAFRGTARMYAFDAKAQSIVQMAFKSGFDTRLDPLHAVWLYMPLMHAESVELQNLSVQKFEALSKRSDTGVNAAMLAGNFKYAHSHRADILKFGRFPYRNSVLSRVSTPQEIEYLKAKSGP